VLILSGDHLYRMDYMDFVQVRPCMKFTLFNSFQLIHVLRRYDSSLQLQNHRQSGADITISSLPMDDRYVIVYQSFPSRVTWTYIADRINPKKLAWLVLSD
jgi:hypothetical protein